MHHATVNGNVILFYTSESEMLISEYRIFIKRLHYYAVRDCSIAVTNRQCERNRYRATQRNALPTLRRGLSV